MLVDHLIGNTVFSDSVLSWKEAIELSAKPLLQKKKITNDYIEAIKKNVEENGSYFILVPEIAIPHARPESGALENSLSCLVLKKPVEFPDGKSAKVLLTLASKGNDGHLEMLGELGEALIDGKKISMLKEASSEEEVVNIFN